MHAEPAFAAIDWGTTRFRAWLLDAAGEVVAERRSDEGLLAVPRERFAAVLEEHLGAMDAPASLPVMMCGMAGLAAGLDRGALCGDAGALRRRFLAARSRCPERAATCASFPGSRSASAIAPT